MPGLQRLMLLIGGLLCVGAFFLPFLSLDYGVGKFHVSGLYYVQSGVDYLQPTPKEQSLIAQTETKVYDFVYERLEKAYKNKSSLELNLYLLCIGFVLLGPIFYALLGLGYLYRAAAGKSFQRGIIFNLLFLVFAAVIFYLFDKEVPLLNLGFFKLANVGYWVAFVGVFVAAFSDFFGKE